MIGTLALLLVLSAQPAHSGSLELSPGPLWDYACENSRSLEALEEGSLSAALLEEASGRLPDPTVRLAVSPLPLETRNGPVEMTLTAHQMIPWPGLLSAGRDLAGVDSRIALLQSEIGGWELRVSITSLWAEMYMVRMEKEYTEGLVDRLDALMDLAGAGYETGMTDATELLILENRLALAVAGIVALEFEIASQMEAMNSILGRPTGEPFHWPESLPSPEYLSPPDPVGEIDRRPVTRFSNLQVERSEAMEALSAGALRPSLELGAVWSAVGDPSVEMGAVDPGRDGLTVFAGLSLPLGWSGAGTTREARVHSVNAADLARMQTLTDVAAERSRLDSVLEGLLVEYRTYGSTVLPNLESIILIREGSWVAGLVTLDRLLDAEDGLHAAKLQMERIYARIVLTVARIMALEGLETERGDFL